MECYRRFLERPSRVLIGCKFLWPCTLFPSCSYRPPPLRFLVHLTLVNNLLYLLLYYAAICLFLHWTLTSNQLLAPRSPSDTSG